VETRLFCFFLPRVLQPFYSQLSFTARDKIGVCLVCLVILFAPWDAAAVTLYSGGLALFALFFVISLQPCEGSMLCCVPIQYGCCGIPAFVEQSSIIW